ncbi:MAG: c-type cytochrome [Gammaproteobacteria bacterium]|nr:c-type cytochrome [Gammaproteobacteria bacterium]
MSPLYASKEELLRKHSGHLISRIFLGLVVFVIAALIIADSHEQEEATIDESEDAIVAVEEDPLAEDDSAAEEEVIDPVSVEAGALIAAENCIACHGTEGNTNIPANGNLAGQNVRYLYQQLKLIKSHERFISVMEKSLEDVDDDGLHSLAMFYSSKPGLVGQANPETDLELGEAIYRGGILDKEVAACTACHGPFGNGNFLAGFPRVSGQTVPYLIEQLRAYREGERTTDDEYGGMMRDIAKKLTDGEISAVANYMTGLYSP